MSNQHDLATVELIITRGLPASGKTTWAKKFVDTQSAYGRRIVRFNRDDFRRMALPSGYAKPDFQSEKLITVIRDAALRSWLSAGYSVILDDTNLRMRWARDLADIAVEMGVAFRVVDFFDVPLGTCIARDDARGAAGEVGFVGAGVIRSMHTRFLASGRPGPVEPRPQAWTLSRASYEPDLSLPEVFLCDLDGTVALMNGRDPYDESRVSEDLPNPAVVATVSALAGLGSWQRASGSDQTLDVVFVSGRSEGCREATTAWLAQHLGICASDVVLFMRPLGDVRPDHVVKLELFNRFICDTFSVQFVLDDRNSVVKLWRQLGLTCFQVADGGF